MLLKSIAPTYQMLYFALFSGTAVCYTRCLHTMRAIMGKVPMPPRKWNGITMEQFAYCAHGPELQFNEADTLIIKPGLRAKEWGKAVNSSPKAVPVIAAPAWLMLVYFHASVTVAIGYLIYLMLMFVMFNFIMHVYIIKNIQLAEAQWEQQAQEGEQVQEVWL